MRLPGPLQERFGFTRSEIVAVLFLTTTFLAGLAGRIIAYRTEHGPFRAVDELAGVHGIGKKKLDRLRPYVVAP